MSFTKHSSCTTVLVGKAASFDGSTIIARNEDAGGAVNPKRFEVVQPDDQPRDYVAKESGFKITLPDNPLRYTSTPDAADDGVWGEAGVNSKNIAMSATETITTNPRVLGADPLVADGVGEEDLLTVTLPYISSAREGVLRVGEILENHGTYESNGIIFSDKDEVWYMETAGGHHWVAQRVPDDAFVIAPNQTGIQEVDFGDKDNFMYSADLKEFAESHNLNLGTGFNFREIFGSHSQLDHHYNTPRAWFAQRYLNPELVKGKGPMSDDLDFICHAPRKITIEDIKYILGSHYQDTQYDPFGKDTMEPTKFRPIGINRNQELSIIQIRPNVPDSIAAVQWLALATNPFNTLVPFFTNVNNTPAYFRDTTTTASTSSAYWTNRIISVIAADHYQSLIADIEDYQEKTLGYGYHRVETISSSSMTDPSMVTQELTNENQATADHIENATNELLTKLVTKAAGEVKGAFSHDLY